MPQCQELAVFKKAFPHIFLFQARDERDEEDLGWGLPATDLWVIVLLSEQFADGFQFPPAFCGGLGICHLKVIERIQDNL